MKHVLLFIFLLPYCGKAQSNVTGLGTYQIGVTTPDSLDQTLFSQQDQSYVKGTIALPCTHIRTFTASAVTLGSITLANLSLAFYDNTLFRLSCDYSDSLKEAFQREHGNGTPESVSRFLVCIDQKDSPLLVWGETWPNAYILAFVVHTKGYDANCQPEATTRLVMTSRRLSALSSDCDVKPVDPIMEAFEKTLHDQHQSPPVKK